MMQVSIHTRKRGISQRKFYNKVLCEVEPLGGEQKGGEYLGVAKDIGGRERGKGFVNQKAVANVGKPGTVENKMGNCVALRWTEWTVWVGCSESGQI